MHSGDDNRDLNAAIGSLAGIPLGGPPTSRIVTAAPSYDRVRDAIRDDIVDGYFGDQSRLVLSVLCARYGVSAAPIREALHQLAVEGLVVLNANRGAKVRAISAEFVTEIFEIRIALEPELVWRNTATATAKDIADLEALEARFEAAVAAKDGQAVSRFNRAFHTRIYEIRPNHEAMRLLGHHEAVIRTLRNRYGYQAERVRHIIVEHRGIIAALARHDAERARVVAREHIEHSLQDILGLIPKP